MKKLMDYSNKRLFIFVSLVIGGITLTFSSVWAADHNQGNNEIDNWTSSGYNEVTVKVPGDFKADFAAPKQECVLDTTGLISHWPLDEPPGSTLFNDVVGSIDGTCQGTACPSKAFGKVSGAFYFNTSEKNVISVPADTEPAKSMYDSMANGDISAGVWVKTTQNCAKDEQLKNKVFIGRYRNVNTHGTWWLGCTTPGVAVFRMRDSNNTHRQINGTSIITDGKWHYIVGVRDAGTDKNYLYVDGKLEGMQDSPNYGGHFSSDMPITMGAYNEPVDYYFDGTLDEVVLYNRVLSQNELKSYFDACIASSLFIFVPIVTR